MDRLIALRLGALLVLAPSVAGATSVDFFAPQTVLLTAAERRLVGSGADTTFEWDPEDGTLVSTELGSVEFSDGRSRGGTLPGTPPGIGSGQLSSFIGQRHILHTAHFESQGGSSLIEGGDPSDGSYYTLLETTTGGAGTQFDVDLTLYEPTPFSLRASPEVSLGPDGTFGLWLRLDSLELPQRTTLIFWGQHRLSNPDGDPLSEERFTQGTLPAGHYRFTIVQGVQGNASLDSNILFVLPAPPALPLVLIALALSAMHVARSASRNRSA